MSFTPSGLGMSIFKDRYSHNGETWAQTAARVAKHVGKAEEADRERWTHKFFMSIVSGQFMPGGRIIYGAGKPKAQLLKCFVIPVDDSREGWGKAFYDQTVISSLGGGVGMNASRIRPRGSYIAGTDGRATGAVSFMKAVNGIGQEIKDGGGRRTALMLDLEVTHPDLIEFLDCKLDTELLKNMNISINLNIPADKFQAMVRNREMIKMEHEKWDGEMYVNAADLWERLVTNAWKNGEPGILNGHLANEMSNIWYYKPLTSTNPCGEIWLEDYGCCCLGALVLPRFVRGGTFDWAGFRDAIRVGVRFLDDVLSVNHYPLEEIEKECLDVRRIGLGVMGLHNMLLELGHKYSSEAGREFVRRLFCFLRDEAYLASVALAQEKGPFPLFRSELFLNGKFIQQLPDHIRALIYTEGIRNCALLTIAPTGTTALVQGVSSGIEPIPAKGYWRQYLANRQDQKDEVRRELVIDPAFEQFPHIAEDSFDLSPRDHFEMQKVVQQYIDNAVSKTINLPEDMSIEELSEVWLEYLPYLKGTTIYRFNSRGQQPITPVSREELLEALGVAHTVEQNVELQLEMECPDGVCEVPQGYFQQV